MKTCKTCGETKPATIEYWYFRRRTYDGVKYIDARCRICKNAYMLAHIKANPQMYKDRDKRKYYKDPERSRQN